MPTPDDLSMVTTCSHPKKIQFAEQNQVLIFDDDAEEGGGGTLTKDSDLYAAHGLIKVYAGIWDLEVTYKGSRTFFLLPLHILLFRSSNKHLNTRKKCLCIVIKVGPQTTTEEIIRTAVSKFMQVKNPEAPGPDKLAQSVVDSYALFLTSANEGTVPYSNGLIIHIFYYYYHVFMIIIF